MIDKKLIPYGGLKKEPFSGTHHGMRYFFRGDDGLDAEAREKIQSFLKQQEEKEQKTFPLSDEGMDEAIAWLFERFETEKSKWLNASRDAMHIVNNQTF